MNAALDKYVIPSGSINSVKLLHPSKAYVLILFKPLFNFKFARLVHPSNALDPIVVIVSANTISVIELHPLNALDGIESVQPYSTDFPDPLGPTLVNNVQSEYGATYLLYPLSSIVVNVDGKYNLARLVQSTNALAFNVVIPSKITAVSILLFLNASLSIVVTSYILSSI